jgi:UrcA family protein
MFKGRSGAVKPSIGRVIATAGLAVAIAAGPASAGAQECQIVQTERVRMYDLDLSRNADVTVLYARLRSAAVRASAIPASSRPDFVDEVCRRRALGDAVAHLDNAELNARLEHRGAVS